MELGESFFDDDDVVVEDKKSISLPQYAPKYCEPEWFCEDIGDSTNDVSKYKADLYYYKKEYKTALHLYEQLLQVLPTTHSQLKREVIDSIIRCCIHCGFSDQGLSYCDSFVTNNDKDHSSWQLMSECHRLSSHIEDEVLCSLKCVLISRHFPSYWLKLHTSFINLLSASSSSLAINTDIIDHTHQLLRPYFNKQDVTDSNHPHYQLFIRYLTTPTLILKTNNEYYIFLTVTSLSTLLRAQQLVSFTMSRCQSSSATVTLCQRLSQEIQSMLNTCADDTLKESVLKHMQTPFEIDI